MAAFGVHKCYRARQATEMEEHTGLPPEELDDDDLQGAMTVLNFPVTAEDRAAGAGTDD
jgi:hypothetical protein